jgi:hypothetical protein
MNRKYVGYALTILGIALIAVGALNVAGYISFQIVDTKPPTILYTFPADKMTYGTRELSEIVVYAQDQSEIVSAVYSDDIVGTVSLNVTPYTQIKHPLFIQGWKYPDVNFDGRVDTTDTSIIGKLYGVKKGDPGYDPTYDLNFDGKIDVNDAAFVASYVLTITFACPLYKSYPINRNITFSITVLDLYGNSASISGSFTTAEYVPLSGQWYINNKEVKSSMLVTVLERNITVTFKCNDTTISETDITAKAIVDSVTYVLTNVGNYTWQTTIELKSGITQLVLEATALGRINKISVQVVTLQLSTFSFGHALIVTGVILSIAGIISLARREEEELF